MYSGCLLTCSDMNAIIRQRTEGDSTEKLYKRSYKTVCSDANPAPVCLLLQELVLDNVQCLEYNSM